jgi:hypothetical protein
MPQELPPCQRARLLLAMKASILSILFVPAHYENKNIKAQTLRIWAFMGQLPLYLLLAEDSNFEPSDVEQHDIWRKIRPFCPSTLKN